MNRNPGLRIVMRIDAWLSFTIPFVLLACVPVLIVVDVPGWVVGTTVFALAGVLGVCGILMAAVLVAESARGRTEFPDEPTLRHFHLAGPRGIERHTLG